MRPRIRRAALALTIVAALAVAVDAGAADDRRGADDSRATSAPCDCARFSEELAAARALYASRGEGATIRLPAPARQRFRERVLASYARARCLVDCTGVPERERDDARVLLATTAYKSRKLGPNEQVAGERLTHALAETERCLTHQPVPPGCRLWHASLRGTLARGSWNPMQLSLPKQLLAEFRAARGDAAPGTDPPDGAATRAEAALLLRAPRVAGGDVAAARALMEQATKSPLYVCTIANRILYAESLARTGAADRAVQELRATLTAGLPSCGDNGYENATDLEEASRCLARLESRPTDDPGWDDDCR